MRLKIINFYSGSICIMCIILSSFAYFPNVVAKKIIIGIEDNPECKDRCALELMIS